MLLKPMLESQLATSSRVLTGPYIDYRFLPVMSSLAYQDGDNSLGAPPPHVPNTDAIHSWR
jgi:hypothetical protein